MKLSVTLALIVLAATVIAQPQPTEKRFFGGVFKRIGHAFHRAAHDVSKGVSSAANTVAKTAKHVVGHVAGTAKNVASTVAGTVSGTTKQAAGTVAGTVAGTGQQAANGVANAAKTVAGAVSGAVSGAANTVVHLGKTTYTFTSQDLYHVYEKARREFEKEIRRVNYGKLALKMASYIDNDFTKAACGVACTVEASAIFDVGTEGAGVGADVLIAMGCGPLCDGTLALLNDGAEYLIHKITDKN